MSDLEIVVRGRRVDVEESFREVAEGKLSRLDRYGVPISRVDVQLSKENNPRLADRAYKVELTCRGRKPVIRAEASAADEHAAFEKASDRLKEQLRRAHDKSRFHRGRDAKRIELPSDLDVQAPLVATDDTPHDNYESTHADEVYAEGPVVVREKTHSTQPMSIDQAVTEMELVGHDFFLFHDVDSDAPAVVYRRRGFDYGLIRIETQDQLPSGS